MVVQIQQLAQFGGKTLGVLQILHTQSPAGDFVFVRRANAFAGGADFLCAAIAALDFTGDIDGFVERQNQRASLADAQARADFNANRL